MATVGSAIVCDRLRLYGNRSLCDRLRSAIVCDRLRSYGNQPSHNKQLMSGPKGNSEFCYPETFNVPRGEAEWNIEGRRETRLAVPPGTIH